MGNNVAKEEIVVVQTGETAGIQETSFSFHNFILHFPPLFEESRAMVAQENGFATNPGI